MKKTISKMFVTATIAMTTATGFAQSNLGADCGCPTPVSSRPTVLLSTLATSGGAGDGELIANNVVLDCSTTWILDKKIYVAPGKTLTIMPGTVIKGRFNATPANAAALTVEVGGKIFAEGTPTCQIVFTAEADNLTGTYAVTNVGQWGGICVAGKATNNLKLTPNGPFDPLVSGKICVADGLGTFEGFASTNTKDQFGIQTSAPVNGVFDDNDNSGILKYVSIRHAGAIMTLGGELNALSLGSVGRGTTIEHVEVVSCADDGIEFWGGTVNVKYCSFLFGNDDNLDWDCGWKGKAQFLFILKNDAAGSVDNDNGFEADADDQKSNLLPRSHPVIYNATIIGNGKSVTTADNSALAGINAKELTEGEIYNSVIANFFRGFNVVKAPGTRTGGFEAYNNWTNDAGTQNPAAPQSLVVKCNTFVGCTDAITVGGAAGSVLPVDLTQFNTTDMNVVVAGNTLPGFNYTLTRSGNSFTAKPDVTPNPVLSVTGCPVAPSDGFFTPANYRGAFPSIGDSWLTPWSYATILTAVSGVAPCPTDINGDGTINITDFNAVLGTFGQSCQ